MKELFVFYFMISISTFSFAQYRGKDSVSLRSALKQKTVSDSNDMMLTATIVSHQNKVVVVPCEALWGYVEYDVGFLAIEVQKKVNGHYLDYPLDSHIDPGPIWHSDSLTMNASKSWSINIAMLFNFAKGQYRVRTLGRLSHYNALHDISSDWFYFICTKKIDGF